MKDVQAIQGMKLHLGRCGENRALCVWFDVGEWQRVYGEGTVHLLHQRNGDLAPYPCQITVDGSMVGWVVTSADVAVAGRGRAELQYHVGDSCVKSDIYITYTTRSMSEAGPVPPEPEEGWVQQVLEAAEETMSAAVAASECESKATASAQSAQTDAVIAAESAREARNSQAIAQESAQAAQEARQAAEKAAEDVTAVVGGDFATKDDLKGKADLVNGKVPSAQLPAMDYAASKHAEQHRSGGADPITPAMIGAATAGHTHTAADVGAAHAEHTHTAEDIGAAPMYTYGTADIEAGSASPYETGHLHFVIE